MSAEPPVEPAGDATSHRVRRAVRDGDLESLGWVIGRLTPLLLAQARYRLPSSLRSQHDPEDLVQEAWLLALDRLADLEPRAGRWTPVLLAFLSRTLLFRINNLVRRRLREGPVPTPDGPPPHVDDAVSRHVVDAVAAAIRSESSTLVRRALEELDPRDREILVLLGIEGHRNQTVAMLLELTPQAVSMRYRRALERLRSRLPGGAFEELA